MTATLRVGSFNIRNGRAIDGCRSWPFRRRALARAIEALDADVLGLQEVHRFQLRWLRGRLPSYDIVALGRDPGDRGEGCPILVRRARATIVRHETWWFGDDPQRPGLRLEGAHFPRIATTCRVELREAGTLLDVTNTHLDERSGARRRRSAEQIAARLDPSVPQVVMGDLNADPSSDVLAVLTAAGLRSALADDAPGTFHRFTGRTDGRRLDHLLVDDRLEVVDASVQTLPDGARLPSDHWPVVATLRLRS